MIERFNWSVISKVCNGDAVLIVAFLRTCKGIHNTHKLSPKLRKLSKRGIPKGVSYIINIDSLLRNNLASVHDIAQYIELCSRRNYVDYKFHRIRSLPSVVAYDSNVQYNRLITVNDSKVHFKYETEENR